MLWPEAEYEIERKSRETGSWKKKVKCFKIAADSECYIKQSYKTKLHHDLDNSHRCTQMYYKSWKLLAQKANRSMVFCIAFTLCDCHHTVSPLSCFLTWQSPSIQWHCHLWRRAHPAQWKGRVGHARGHHLLYPGWTGPAGMVCLHREWVKAKGHIYNNNNGKILEAFCVTEDTLWRFWPLVAL